MRQPIFRSTNAYQIVVWRYPNNSGHYVDGIYIVDTDIPYATTIRANVQPTGGKNLENDQDAQRSKDSIIVFTLEDVFTTSQPENSKADRVEWDGAMYEVQGPIRKYRMNHLDHFEADCKRLSEVNRP